MKLLKIVIPSAAAIVFLICVYTFLLGNEVFKGKFTNDSIAWYFLAKGIFCSLTLILVGKILAAIHNIQKAKN